MTRTKQWLLLTSLFLPLPLAAQDPAAATCDGSLTAIECARNTFNDAADASVKQAAKEKIQKSPSADLSPGSASSVRDFLPTFFASLGLGTVTESDGALTLTFNPELMSGEHAQWSLVGRLHEPAPLEKLVMAAPEADRSAVKTAIGERLEDFDDVEITATFTYRSERFGRDFTFHSATAATFLDQSIGDSVSTPALQSLADLLEELARKHGVGVQTATFGELRESPSGQAIADQLDAHIAAAAVELKASRAAIAAKLKATDYFKIAQLVDNQPQLTVSFKARERDDLVGQDSFTVDAAFEWGAVNVNRFKKWCAKKSRSVDSGCLSAYWQAKGANAEQLPRFKFSLDWESLDDLSTSFTLPAPAPMMGGEGMEPALPLPVAPLELTLPGSEKIVASASYGRYLRRDDQGNQLSRFDFEAKYEYVDDEQTRNKRYLASLTYSQRVSDTASATVGFVYASDPEFRGEVNKEFSARAGLKFKLDRKDEE